MEANQVASLSSITNEVITLSKEEVDDIRELVKQIIQTNNNNNNKDKESQILDFLMAVAKNQTEVVKNLLETTPLDVKGPSGEAALFMSADQGHTKIVKLLAEHGALLNTTDQEGRTALFRAAQNGHAEVVEVLLAKDADINIANQDGDTPLFIAALASHTEVVEVLLANNADVNIANQDGEAPLFAASLMGHKEVVEVLLANNADVSIATQAGDTPLFIASAKGHTEVVKALLEKGADVNIANQDGETPLFAATLMGRTGIVKSLLAKAVLTDIERALTVAISSETKEIIKLLLEKIAEIAEIAEIAVVNTNSHPETVNNSSPSIEGEAKTNLSKLTSNDQANIIETIVRDTGELKLETASLDTAEQPQKDLVKTRGSLNADSPSTALKDIEVSKGSRQKAHSTNRD